MSEIEYLLIADHAEATNGKLYVIGAGWTDQWRGVPEPGGGPQITHFGIGVSILVAWNDTNRPHHLVLRIEAEDGQVLGQVEADLEVGRPTGIPRGSDQRAVLALNVNIQFPAPGGYRVAAVLGEQTRTASFRVHDQIPPGVQVIPRP